jgi:trehalose synthase
MAKEKFSQMTMRQFAEHFFPARPGVLWSKARGLTRKPLRSIRNLGPAIALNTTYIRWLKKGSMLYAAKALAVKYSGSGHMWRNPYANPRPRAAINKASVWYTAYPPSIINNDESILATLGREELWEAFEKIGIEGMHTGPMKMAGGIKGWKFTPSIDGHFDRISTRIDTLFGTEAEFQKMTITALNHNGIIIDDIVPGHTQTSV